MSYQEHSVEKLYYSIGETANMFNVNPSLIRYWEKEFDIITPYKNKKGKRFFTKKDINNFHMIYHLVKEQGMTLKGAKKKLKENRQGTERVFDVIQKLKYIKDELHNIKQEIH